MLIHTLLLLLIALESACLAEGERLLETEPEDSEEDKDDDRAPATFGFTPSRDFTPEMDFNFGEYLLTPCFEFTSLDLVETSFGLLDGRIFPFSCLVGPLLLKLTKSCCEYLSVRKRRVYELRKMKKLIPGFSGFSSYR